MEVPENNLTKEQITFLLQMIRSVQIGGDLLEIAYQTKQRLDAMLKHISK